MSSVAAPVFPRAVTEKRHVENDNAVRLVTEHAQSDGFYTSIAASSVEEEKRHVENDNAVNLVTQHVQKNAHRFRGVFDPPRDSDSARKAKFRQARTML